MPIRHRPPDSSSTALKPCWAEYQATLDPRVLWPHVVPRHFDAAMAQIVRVTRERLLGTPERSEMLSRSYDPSTLGVAAYVAGMGPLLGYWVEERRLRVGDEPADILARHLDHGRRRFARLESALQRLLGAFAQQGVRATLLKGIHTGRAYLPDAGTRPLADIDLLVSAADFSAACVALEAAGFLERRRTMRPFRSEWVQCDDPMVEPSLELNHVNNPWAVDLHCSLDRRYSRGCAVDLTAELEAHTDPVLVAGHEAAVLAQPLLTAFLALHASYAIHQLQLIRLVELVLVIRRDCENGSLHWRALLDLLGRTRTRRFVYPAFELAERLAPGTLDPITGASLREASSARMQRVVRGIAAGETFRLSKRSLDDKLMWAGGLTELAGCWSELIWPSDQRFSARARLATQLRFLKNAFGYRA